jgi:ParB/RepB/Spo0J family partition protein
MKQPELKQIPINQIHAASNYRKTFRDASLKELAQSIKKNGVIEPIIVRPNNDGYQIVAGERRFRASKIAGLVRIPAIVREIADAEILTVQIIENVQREGVPFMEEAYGIKKLRDDCSLDVKEIAEMVGKSDAYVYVMLKLTAMPEEVQTIFRNGWINKGVAWEITKIKDPEHQIQAAKDLARTKAGNQISASHARFYINNTFREGGPPRRRNGVQKSNGNDFNANWKFHLVRFTAAQFDEFKKIVKGRTETDVLSEAVDCVMRGEAVGN